MAAQEFYYQIERQSGGLNYMFVPTDTGTLSGYNPQVAIRKKLGYR